MIKRFEKFDYEDVISLSDKHVLKVANELGYDYANFVAMDTRGALFDVDENKSLRITTDEQEFKSATKLIKYNTNHIIDYYDARKIKVNYYDSGYAIVSDKIIPLTDEQKQYYNFEMSGYPIWRLVFEVGNVPKLNIVTLKYKLFGLLDNDGAIDMWLEIINQRDSILEEFKKYKIDAELLDPDNVGFNTDGLFVIFDLNFFQKKNNNKIIYINESVKHKLSDDRIEKIAALFNTSVDSYIASGEMGDAYLLKDNKVLKITTDKHEASVCKNLKGIKSKHLVDIYDIKKIVIKGTSYYAIHMEKVTPLSDLLDNRVGMSLSAILLNPNTAKINDDRTPYIKKVLQAKESILDELKTHNIDLYHITSFNYGLDDKGEIKIFDITGKNKDNKEIDTVILEKKDITTSKLRDAIVHELGYNKSEYLASGHFGNVYLLDGYRILKETKDSAEFTAACYIKKHLTKHLVNVYDTVKAGDVYFYTMDKITPLDESESLAYNILHIITLETPVPFKKFKMENIEDFNKINKTVNISFLQVDAERAIEKIGFDYFNYFYNKYIDDALKMFDEASKYRLNLNELHGGNVGFKDGMLVGYDTRINANIPKKYINYKVFEFFKEENIIGVGDFGKAYRLDDGKVLKITKDKTEYLTAKQLKGENYKHLVHIYDYGEYLDRYFIVMDYIEPLEGEDKRLWDSKIEYYSIRNHFIDVHTTDDKFLEFLNTSDYIEVINYWKNLMIQRPTIVDELSKNGIFDVHSGNVGKRGDTIIFFDLVNDYLVE